MQTKKPLILLPSKLPILRARRFETNPIEEEEFSIYYSNIIFPYNQSMDVIISCEYGANYGEFWRIRNYPSADSFPLTLAVYDESGEKLAESTTVVELYERRPDSREFSLLCIGDSMTHRHMYVDHLASKVPNLKLIGTRCYNGRNYMEGRGGWSGKNYTRDYHDIKNGPSPFIFPVGISGKEYYGDLAFERKIENPDANPYALDGFAYRTIKNGQVYWENNCLYRLVNNIPVLEKDSPQWEFSFEKYMDKFGFDCPDAVSILLGANDYQTTDYEKFPMILDEYINNLQIMIDSIKSYNPKLPIILNMPVYGAEGYAWGLAQRNSAKRYHHHVALANERIISRWDDMETIFLSPMMVNLDPEFGFKHDMFRANMYSEELVCHHSNWVHPSRSGYCQMADALAGTIEKLRNKRDM